MNDNDKFLAWYRSCKVYKNGRIQLWASIKKLFTTRPPT
jgi:hypothetical protein